MLDPQVNILLSDDVRTLWFYPHDIYSIFPWISGDVGTFMNYGESVLLPYPNYPHALLFCNKKNKEKLNKKYLLNLHVFSYIL